MKLNIAHLPFADELEFRRALDAFLAARAVHRGTVGVPAPLPANPDHDCLRGIAERVERGAVLEVFEELPFDPLDPENAERLAELDAPAVKPTVWERIKFVFTGELSA